MNKRNLITIATVAAALAPAAASAQAAYQSAAFEATLKGNQVSTWQYSEDSRENCGSLIETHGDQTIRFASGRKGRMLVGQPPNGRTLVALSSNSVPGPWEISAEADRNGTFIADGTGRANCDGDNGGGVEPR